MTTPKTRTYRFYIPCTIYEQQSELPYEPEGPSQLEFDVEAHSAAAAHQFFVDAIGKVLRYDRLVAELTTKGR